MATQKEHKLGQWFATAICGNDILSSTLYVSGIAIIFAGAYAPIVLLIIGLVLFLYKSVYTEVVEALPVNGGAYNCLLNGTSKVIAAIAGVMTFLSYIATAVISGKVGVEYLHTIIPGLPIIPGTIVLLLAFALLVISGIKDSAKVALVIFIIHILTLLSVLIFGTSYFFTHGAEYFLANIMQTKDIIAMRGSIMTALFLGFSASLLGVSGFESSANFVEEQAPGVFRKTLRNMLAGVAFFNPLIALVVLNAMPIDAIAEAKDFLLADAAHVIGGQPLQFLVAIDAFMVLSGAVLTSFVGVGGLLYRMTADACLPNFLNKVNTKGSYPRIVILFFLLCSSILILTKGDLLSLAGVYTISFLGVMSLFALGNLVLKETRTELKRTYHAPIPYVLVAFIATFIGIVGNIFIDVRNLQFFSYYFVPVIVVVLVIVYQDYLAKFALRITKNIPTVHKYILRHFQDMTQGKFIIFIHHISRLHRVLDYVNRNETGWNIILVHCDPITTDPNHTSYKDIKEALPILQKAGVYPHLNIELVHMKEAFGPNAVMKAALQYGVRRNRVLIGSIRHEHPFEYDDFGGVRIIF